MIFGPALLPLVLAGAKTMTRRRRVPGLLCRYRAGRTYGVQPARTARAVARIRVLAVRAAMLVDLTEEDARREGFPDRAAFFAYWRELYHEDVCDMPVWVVTFALQDRWTAPGCRDVTDRSDVAALVADPTAATGGLTAMSLRDSSSHHDGPRDAPAPAAGEADATRASGPPRVARQQRRPDGARRDDHHAGDGDRGQSGDAAAPEALTWILTLHEIAPPEADARWREALLLLLRAAQADA